MIRNDDRAIKRRKTIEEALCEYTRRTQELVDACRPGKPLDPDAIRLAIVQAELAMKQVKGALGRFEDDTKQRHSDREVPCGETYYPGGTGPECVRPHRHEGGHRYKCASPRCPGYAIPASAAAHPVDTCN